MSAETRATSRFMPEPATLRVVSFVLLAKLLLLAYGVVAAEVLRDVPVRSARDALALWERWDALHYLGLAEHGYVSQGEDRWRIAFLPLLPWLIRALARLGLGYSAAGFVVSTATAVAAALLLRRLAALDADAEEAERAVFFLLVFPTSYFLHAAYTEGLFLALTLSAFLAARRRRFVAAGALGGLAALSRVTGVLLLPVLALEALADWRETGRLRRAWLGLGLILVGLGLYLALNVSVTGEPFAFLRAHHEHWYRSSDWPWNGLAALVRARAERGANESQMLGTQELLFALLTLGATIVSVRRQRASYALWMALNWVIFVGQGFVYCVPRFALTLFPLFLLFGRLSRERLWAAGLTLWSVLFLALFTALFVLGRWAF